MSIGSINYPHSNTIEKTLQKTPSLEQDRRTLQSDLKSVKNALSEVYKNLTKEQDAKKREESLLSPLVKVSQNNGDNSTIRLKNGYLKFEHKNNIIKNLLSQDRYKSERKKAANYFEFSGDKVSVADAISKITNKIKNIDKRTKELSHDECRLKIEEEKITYQLKIKDDLYNNFLSIKESARKFKT